MRDELAMIVRIAKKSFFLFFLALYVIFIPFLFVRCGVVDRQFVVATGEDDETLSPDASLSACLDEEYVTVDCASLVQEEQERQAEIEGTLKAVEEVEDLIEICFLSSAEGVCIDADDAETLIAAHEICAGKDGKYYKKQCNAVFDSFDVAVDDCEHEAHLLDKEFCDPLLKVALEPSDSNVNTTD